MEHFVVSARKYRPQTFKDVVGQQAITNTLLNAIENNHLAQGLLFTGPRGVGKTTCARILAKKINQQATEDLNEDFAFNIFELDAASNNSVDDIRNLIDQVRIPPQVGQYKVYIIDEVHMLSSQAFNAFLKTLEEPPKHAIFILATTEKHKIIPTILSRCQIFDFKRITVSDAKEYLAYIAEQEGVTAEDDALHIIAQKADGAMRDALSIFDRVVSFSGNNLTRKAVTENLNVLDYDTYLSATDLILQNDIPQLLLLFNEVLATGFDGHHFIAGLASHFRDLLVCKDPKTINLLEVGDNTKAKYYEQSQKASSEFLLKGIELANTCDLEYKNSRNQRLLVELCLMQLASIGFDQEKKKDSPFIIPASHFKDAPVPPPALKISREQKAVITNNEYSVGDSAAPKEAQLPTKNGAGSASCDPELNNKVKEEAPGQKEQTSTNTSGESSTTTSEESRKPSGEGASFEGISSSETTVQSEKTGSTKTESTSEKPAPSDNSRFTATTTSVDSESQADKTTSSETSTPSEPAASVTVETPREGQKPAASAGESLASEDRTTETSTPKAASASAPPVNIPIQKKKVSGLSLKSIQKKKEIEAQQRNAEREEQAEKDGSFTEAQMQDAWKEFIGLQNEKGEKILASIMETDIPKLDGKKIVLELPNETMKLELERIQYPLMGFMKEKLQNTLISLEIKVNETIAKKFAFTPREKYEKLKEKNAMIEKLRTTFDLDI